MTLQVMYGTKGRCFLFRENIGLTVDRGQTKVERGQRF